MAARYDWFGEEGMKRDDEGFYVRHEDYAQELADAQAEIARLRGALEAALNETCEGNVAAILEDALQK